MFSNMRNLIIPLCGKSTRFPNTRPKWMLSTPEGDFMVVKAILGIKLQEFDRIYLSVLPEHQAYGFEKGLKENLKSHGLGKKVKIVVLEPTKSQPETVYKTVLKEKIKGSIFIKDCDNYFELEESPEGNCVAYCSLSDFDNINANNKSYINIGENNQITNIIEKEIVSTTFCCGGYGFEDAQDFVKTYETHQYRKDLYISDIIFDSMIKGGKSFAAIESQNYVDFGTAEDWQKYRDKFKTIIIDLDGVLVKHSSIHLPPYIGTTDALEKNVQILRTLWDSEKDYVFIVITTSRPNTPKARKITEKQLKKLDIPYNVLMMGLPHCSRVLINDFSESNPHPSAVAINLTRDGDDLEKYL